MTEAVQNIIRKEFFDNHAVNWNENNHSEESISSAKKLLERVILSFGMKVLDVGCGQGIIIPYLYEKIGDKGEILALDLSSKMLQGLIQRYPYAKTINADVHNVPLPDCSIDIITCFCAFPHFANKNLVAKEFYRLLVPNGKIYILHNVGRENLNKLHDKYEAVCGDHLPCPIGIQKIFGSAGFKNMQVDESSEHYYFCAIKD